MRLHQWMAFLALGPLAADVGFSLSIPPQEQIQVSQCLASKLENKYPVIAENGQFKLLNVPEDKLQEINKIADKYACGRFINRTSRLNPQQLSETAVKLLTTANNKKKSLDPKLLTLSHNLSVQEAIEQINVNNILSDLTSLTNFVNRSAKKTSGVQAAKWLKETFDQMAEQSGRSDVESYFIDTGYYRQPSLVTVFNKNSQAPAVIIGAHMDTPEGRMPGAGDDGSGSATIMEVARILLNSKHQFNRPLYIIWYAAEERGLVGSQYVVKDFKKKHIPVLAVLQFDMTGYRYRNEPTMWIYRDYTDDVLSNYIAELIKTYVGVPVGESECGYGCSDHASWTEEGFPAAFPCETNFEHHNPKIHTSGDTMDRLTPEHMVNFTKLALAYAIELTTD